MTKSTTIKKKKKMPSAVDLCFHWLHAPPPNQGTLPNQTHYSAQNILYPVPASPRIETGIHFPTLPTCFTKHFSGQVLWGAIKPPAHKPARPLRAGSEVHPGSQGCTATSRTSGQVLPPPGLLSLGTPAGEPVQLHQLPGTSDASWLSAFACYLHYCPQDPIYYLEPSFWCNWDFF